MFSDPVPTVKAVGELNVWFSTYKVGTTPKLAAIITNLSDDHSASSDSGSAATDQETRAPLNTREAEVLRLVVQGMANKEIAAGMNIRRAV